MNIQNLVHPNLAVRPVEYFVNCRYNVAYNNNSLSTDDVMAMVEGRENETDQSLSEKIDELRKHVEESFLKVHVYFKSSTAEIIVETPKYEEELSVHVLMSVSLIN